MVEATALTALAKAGGSGPDADPAGASLRYRRVFSAESDWELDEYRFRGRPVLPASALVELVLVAARSLAVIPEAAVAHLRELAFMSLVDGSGPVELVVVISPAADAFRFQVRSRPVDQDQDWSHHLNGILAAAGDESPLADTDRIASCAQALAPVTAPVGPAAGGELLRGPRWDCPVSVAEGSVGTLSRIALPNVYRGEGRVLHPGLFDRALTTPPALPVGGGQVLPFLCGQITVLAPLPAQILAWTPPVHADGDVQVRDVDIFDPDGQRLLVRVRSYAQRLVSVEDFAQRLGPVRPVRVTPTDAAPPVDEPIAGEVSSGGSGDGPDGSPDVDDMTAVIRTLWSDALGVADIGLDDDFFDLGGNSLTAVQLTGWLAERLRVELDVGLLFEASTIRHLVAALSPAGEPDSR